MATPLVDNTGKPLTTEQIWEQVDWTNKQSIQTTFPPYMRELLSFKKAPPKAVNIELFSMKTPFGDRFLLKDTDLILEANKRQALFGANATGKSLLFRSMNEGKIKDFPKHMLIHHCKEFENHELSDTVLGTIVKAHPFRKVLVACIEKLESLIAAAGDDAERKAALKENLGYVEFQMKTIGGNTAEERAIKMLRVLGFDEFGQKKLVSELSGGLRMRVALCMAFIIEPDLLLLDEPTNHLDFPSVLWLENRLRGYKSSFLVVSHDRELLNNVCTAVLLIEELQIKYYNVGFKEFEKKKAQEDKKRYEEIEKFLQKNQNVDPSTFLGRQKHDKKQWSEQYHAKQIALQGKFTFPAATPLDNPENLPLTDISLLNAVDVRFSYKPETNVYIFNDPINFNVTASTRCGVMGPNGAGKSTLLKMLTKQHFPTSGKIVEHPKFTLAYFGQYSTHELDLEKTPAEWMGVQFPGEQAGSLRSHLAKTSIVGTVQDTRMEALSFSQKSCIVFSKLTYRCPHLLILDEPTNFLDLESVDSLIAACNKYAGALLLVSHNRDFLKKCAKTYLSVVPGKFLLFDNMKDAERSTYTFIAEMEEGGIVSAQDLVKKNAGGASVHASQDLREKKEEEKGPEDGIKVLSISGSSPSPMPAKKSAAPAAGAQFTVGEKVQALWTDGKWYDAVIKKVIPETKYQLTYTAYGNTVNIEAKSIRKVVAAPAAKAVPAAAAAAPQPATARAQAKK
jgi:ATPase subunit of ABC transporter with duplicated ATPase domains